MNKKLQNLVQNKYFYLVMSALVAGLTVGGKAIGKSIAVKSCTKIVHLVGRVIHSLNRISKKKK